MSKHDLKAQKVQAQVLDNKNGDYIQLRKPIRGTGVFENLDDMDYVQRGNLEGLVGSLSPWEEDKGYFIDEFVSHEVDGVEYVFRSLSDDNPDEPALPDEGTNWKAIGVVIDDDSTSGTTIWSSEKITQYVEREKDIYFADMESDHITYINSELTSTSFSLILDGFGLLTVGKHYFVISGESKGFQLIGGLVMGADNHIMLTGAFASPPEDSYSDLVSQIDSRISLAQKNQPGGIPDISTVALRMSIAEIRAINGTLKSSLLYTTDSGTEGYWRYDPTDTTTPDDTGIVLVTADGKRFKRIFIGAYDPRWYLAKADGVTNDAAAFLAACHNNSVLEIPNGVTLFIGENLDVPNFVNLKILIKGVLKLGEGVRLTVSNGTDVVCEGKIIGNMQVKSHVSGLLATPGKLAITVTDNTGDDFSRFTVGDSIQTYKIIDGIRVRAYRGLITSIVGNVLNCNDDNSLGGSSSRASIGDEIIAIQAARYTGVSFTDCVRPKMLNSTLETVVAYTRCTDFLASSIESTHGGLSVTFCNKGIIANYNNSEANFYGLALFKSRSISVSNVNSDKSLLGGVVSKANWDTTFSSIMVRRAAVYAGQFRNDSGTVPNLVNPELQNTLYSLNVTLVNFKAIDCALGLWIDQEVRDMYIASANISGTINGASLLYEATAAGIASNVHFGELIVKDHFVHGAPDAGYFESNSPIRLAAGSYLQIDKLVAKNCRHTSKIISTTSSGFKNLIIGSAEISNCIGEVEFSGVTNVRATSLSVKDPLENLAAGAIRVTNSTNVMLMYAEVSSSNGFTYGFGTTVSGTNKNVRVNYNTYLTGITQAGIIVYGGDGAEASDIIEVTHNRIECASLYGVSVRQGATNLVVIENDISGPTQNLHTADLTSIDHRIESKKRCRSASFSAATIAAAGNSGDFQQVDISFPGVGPSSGTFNIQWAMGGGSTQGLEYSADVPTTNIIRVYRRNRTASSVSAQARDIKITINSIL